MTDPLRPMDAVRKTGAGLEYYRAESCLHSCADPLQSACLDSRRGGGISFRSGPLFWLAFSVCSFCVAVEGLAPERCSS